MAKDDKKNSAPPDSSEAEYKIDLEKTGQESLEVPVKSGFSFGAIKERLLERLPKNKKYRYLLYLLVAVYVVYQFINVATPTDASSPQKATEKLVQQPLAKSPPPVEAVELVKPSAPVMTKAEPTITVTSPAVVNAADYHAQIKELQSSLDEMNASVLTLESSLLTLTSSVIRLADKVSILEKPVTFKDAPTTYAKYHVYSLISGRAWIQSSGGVLTTVAVGDMVPGYGRVLNIDLPTGMITTESGRVIQYGPNDT